MEEFDQSKVDRWEMQSDKDVGKRVISIRSLRVLMSPRRENSNNWSRTDLRLARERNRGTFHLGRTKRISVRNARKLSDLISKWAKDHADGQKHVREVSQRFLEIAGTQRDGGRLDWPKLELAFRQAVERDDIEVGPSNDSIIEIFGDDCFLEPDEIEHLLDRLREKKNLILQGPPGTGKTWIAKRLAFALMGSKDTERIRRVQFHPNLSYEDFVRGWRPSGKRNLVIEDGVFMQAIHRALGDPSSKFVVVIEEINRGNPAQVFGELLTLLEADKRKPEEAVELCYPDSDGKRLPVHVPENLYVIGTMNTADRSLALIDLAFRRRFAFADLEPQIGDRWREWVIKERGIDGALADDIVDRIRKLNRETISVDKQLGDQFQIGHSFVTPVRRLEADETRDWFKKIVLSEIGPQLKEYWFDYPKKAQDAIDQLLEGW